MSTDPLELASPVKDELVTETSIRQDEVVEECLPLLADDPLSVPHLRRDDHTAFLKDRLHNATHIAYDASRPWILYWCLTGLCALGQDVTVYRQSVIETLTPAQNAGGGFGGGHGFLSHAAPSYAAVLSLAMVGGEEALDLIDRRALQVQWKFVM
ncbi:uncharacterized protein KY384_004272 [Bacidia gigantensis]|uniref:uncharacterized protein n=1 Tax=Bacidia gigantensis TaxID=2732470 RepID=UPI001D05611B|nr:uncharacterized protein KY384_004272 [Bacidia gigantensis]KAG8530915.1 hypothetical protein KY384_004272 [Bacidia gigantensis]